MKLFFVLAVAFLLSACGDEKNRNGSTGGAITPGTGTSATWTREKVDLLIACSPQMESSYVGKTFGEKGCKCIEDFITSQFTPGQVENKSPLILEAFIQARSLCGSILQ